MTDRSWKAPARGQQNSWWAAIPPEERFWLKVWPRGDCWEWRGATDRFGHGHVAWAYGNLRSAYAHRVACELIGRYIPPGFQVDHLCGHPWCVRPSHLDPVSPRLNNARSNSWSGRNLRKTHCLHGHLFDKENTYSPPAQPGRRKCIKCALKGAQEWRARRKAASL